MNINQKTIFLHYFDIHFLDEKIGNTIIPPQIIDEMNIATKFALLSSDKILVPASSYFESDICRNILLKFNSLFDIYFYFVGKAKNIIEFKDSKLEQYESGTVQYEKYFYLSDNESTIPFLGRNNSSTNDIKKTWNQKRNIGDIERILDEKYKKSKAIDNWKNVPSELGKKAFIVTNVLPILVPDIIKTELSLKNKLHEIINKAYFLSYLNEYKAGYVDDLHYLHSNFFSGIDNWSVSYSNIFQFLRENNLLGKYLNVPIGDLPYLKKDWHEVLENVLEKKKEKQYYRDALSKGDKSPSNVYNIGVVIMQKNEQIGIKGSHNKITGAINQAIGENIVQQNGSIFEQIGKEIEKNISDEDIKNDLLNALMEMEKNKGNKKIFKEFYEKFINKLGVYMSIIGPFLPYLVDYFK